jgi:hypothetical protein
VTESVIISVTGFLLSVAGGLLLVKSSRSKPR